MTDPSITKIRDSEIGAHLYESIARFLDGLCVPRGLKAVGYVASVSEPYRNLICRARYTTGDIGRLVEGTIPQRRVLDLAPGIGDIVGSDGREYLTSIMERSMEY